MGKFITNFKGGKKLSTMLKNTLTASKNIDILVGFFYFSGFENLYEELKDKNIRILVGMDTELTISKAVKEVLNFQENKTKFEQKQDFLKQIEKIFNETDLFDSEKSLKAFYVFLEKLENGSLQIRKTAKANHAKLYLFYYKDELSQNGEHPGALITGSSNFTYSGLEGRYELNARFDDKESFQEGKEIFESLWASSVEIPNQELVSVLKEKTWLKIYSPFALYVKLLKEYFEINIPKLKTPSMLTDGDFRDLKYQVDALKRALKIIRQYNGVIVADVVGLGKSILGASIIANLNENALIISPPHLQQNWEEYAEKFDIKVKIFSSGKLEKARDFVNENPKYKVVLVDEAHKFRNDDTLDYGFLHQICQNKKVILLSATPFNNEPKDIFNLIKLFQIPKNSILGGGDLQHKFSQLQTEYMQLRKDSKTQDVSNQLKKLSQKIKELIGPIIIRRSRLDLEKIPEYKKDLEIQKVSFSKVENPKTIEFSLGSLEKLYWETIDTFLDKKNFTYARYTPLLFLKNWRKYENEFEKFYAYSYGLIKGRQENMNLFMTRQVVGRFESSLYSFKKTLDKLIKSYENFFQWIEKYKAIPIIRKGIMPEISDIPEDLEIDKKEFLAEKYAGFLVNVEDLEDDFFKNLEKDYEILKNLKEKWENINQDPKLDSLILHLKKSLETDKNRKIVLFSQYADTIDYLEEKLKDFRVLAVTGKTKTQSLKQKIRENFDAGYKEQKDEYDILLATDAISEGYNLHRAGTIINYDIPYNPTVIIQRVGRINRINKKVFDTLYIYNYFPSESGENIVHHKKISKLKLDMIALILGIDTKILDQTDPVGSFYKQQLQQEQYFQEEESWDTKYFQQYSIIKQNHPELIKQASKMPNKLRVKRFKKLDNTKLVGVFQKQDNFIFRKISKDGEVENLLLEEGFDMFQADENEKYDQVSKDFYKYYEKLKDFSFITADKIQTQTKKAKDNLLIYKDYFSNPEYVQLLLKVVLQYNALPKVYMGMLRDFKKDKISQQVKTFEKLVSISYLQNIIEAAGKGEKAKFDLMMVEEMES